MMTLNFLEMLQAKWKKGSAVCVGLDSEFGKIPESFRRSNGNDPRRSMVAFNRDRIEQTHDLLCAYKPNIAFYEAYGHKGLLALRQSIRDIKAVDPTMPVILDAKRADIGNTNAGYVQSAFEYFNADAITVHPYLGAEALQPFLKNTEKGVIVLVRTSNPGAGEFQDLHTLRQDPRAKPEGMSAEEWLKILCEDSKQLYERVAINVATQWNKNGNCLAVVGATYPVQAKKVRGQVGNLPFLIPGIGGQGGDVEATVLACHDSNSVGMVINSSSAIIFNENPRAKTLELKTQIQSIPKAA